MAGHASRLANVPKPPAFLDPLFTVDDCYHYSVPKFYDTVHPTSCWLLKRIIADDTVSLRRKLEISPDALRNRYFQLLDDPAIYMGDRAVGAPMFHNKCILYLTPLGLCLYFRCMDAMNLLLSFRTTTNEAVASPDEPQFASHLQDTTEGDFHAFVPYMIMVRREFFESACPLQACGWRPNKPIAMPLRRRYERSVLYYRDWLDAALAQLSCRPVFPIVSLVHSITASPLYSFSRLPMVAVKPQSPSEQPPSAKKAGKKKGKRDTGEDAVALYRRCGNLNLEDAPFGVPLVGVKSIVEICQAYDQQRQKRSRAIEVFCLLKEARAIGLNTEILMMQAEESIEPDAVNQGDNDANSNVSNATAQGNPHWQQMNRNNHASKKSKKSKPDPDEEEHCSEPLRILLFCLTKNKSGNSLQQCLDTLSVYVKRNYFSCHEQLPFEHGRSRDIRNVTNCLLNVISRELTAIDVIVLRLRNGDPRHRSLFSMKQQHVSTINKVSNLMTTILLSCKEVVSFLAANTLPPYSQDSVDFKARIFTAGQATTIRYGMVRDLNKCHDSWKYLTKDMLAKVVTNSAILLHLKVGTRPTKEQMEKFTKTRGKGKDSKSSA